MVGPYLWKTYDLLVLPPSFPFGGMENPNLTFVTPGLIVSNLLIKLPNIYIYGFVYKISYFEKIILIE